VPLVFDYIIKDVCRFDSTGIDEIVYDLMCEISAKNNPKSKYGDEYR
jgi:hypothetical protein